MRFLRRTQSVKLARIGYHLRICAPHQRIAPSLFHILNKLRYNFRLHEIYHADEIVVGDGVLE
jgi:hypothetical protein